MDLRRYFRRAQQDRDQLEELESYVAIATDENIARGMPPDEARQAARRKLGNRTVVREEVYRMNTIMLFDLLGRSARHAWRTMRHNPMFTATALLTIAIGIGANTAIFAVINGILIKPLPYPEPDRLIEVGHIAPAIATNGGDIRCSPALYFTYREENRTFQNVGLWRSQGASVTGLGDPENVRTLVVTYGTLQAVGVQPIMGRWFSPEDDSPTGTQPSPVILTYGYWQRRFGGDKSIIGRGMTVASRPSQIIGVMPQGFRFLSEDPELILPFRFDRNRQYLGNFGWPGIARLKPGVTMAQANADMERMLAIWLRTWPTFGGLSRQVFEKWEIRPAPHSLKDDVVGAVKPVLWVVMGTIGMVLLIACANVANLLLVRAEGRQQELAVRAALGAGRRRIAAELLFESLLLGLVGGALGLGLAYAGVRALVAIGPANLPRLSEISIDPAALAFALAVSLLSGLLFGSIPALKYAGLPLAASLRGGGRNSSQSRERHRARNILVVAQVALALVLLVGSGLMIRTFQSLRNVAPGFAHAQELQTFRIAIFALQVPQPERITRMQNDILDKLAAIPGVTSAGFVSTVPMEGLAFGQVDAVFAKDKTYDEGATAPGRRIKYISPGFFKTMGTRLIAGRDLTWTDIYDHRPVAILSENLAREMWAEPAAALGKQIQESSRGPWREVIGVVEDVHDDGLHQVAPTTAYWPVMMADFYRTPLYFTNNAVFVIRSTQAGAISLLNEVQRAVWSVNPNLPLARVRTMQEIYDQSLAATSFTLVMLVIAGAMALLLGIVGIYGVISYAVSQRRREIGIRLALGAQQGELRRMFVRYAVALAGIGVAIGLGAAMGLTRLMKSLLFGIGPLDPVTYAAVPLVLVAAAMLASYLPARRASAVDPVEALRAE